MLDQVKSENQVEHSDDNVKVIEIIIRKAMTDERFKKDLLEKPDETLAPYDLSEISKIMIKSLSADDFDKLTPENIEEYFSADSAIYTPDFDADMEIKEADEDDI